MQGRWNIGAIFYGTIHIIHRIFSKNTAHYFNQCPIFEKPYALGIQNSAVEEPCFNRKMFWKSIDLIKNRKLRQI